MATGAHSSLDASLVILSRLRDSGFVAYLAGGCVRDRILGRPPKDHDIATSATPDQVKSLYPKARLVGAKFGVVLVRQDQHDVEVATFRTDGAYSDGRRPDAVAFGDERADALRRDFTINGLFYDPHHDRVIDYVGGQEDISRHIIRTIGEPDARFAEDHLRMLRAVRLSARLGFPIEQRTREAMTRLAGSLIHISPERIWMELEIILTEPSRATGWQLLRETGLRNHLAGAWPPDPHRDDVAGRRLAALAPQPVGAGLALAAAMPDSTAFQCEEVCLSFRLSNRLMEQVKWLTSKLPFALKASELMLADFKMLRAQADWNFLLELLRADLIARGSPLEAYTRAIARTQRIPQSVAAATPLISGNDLIALGLTPGSQFGLVLQAVYREQLNETICTRDEAVALALRLWRQTPSN